MRFGSVCSGIEAASVAWNPIGWEAAWLAEVDVAASLVLANRFGASAPVYPAIKTEKAIAKHEWGDRVTNWGDMTRLPGLISTGIAEAPDVLCGGTPCQSFSLAGKREGLNDARGNLTLSLVQIADSIDKKRSENGEQPCIIVYENVPGLLSDKTNAFGCLLAGLAGEDVPLEPPGGKWTNAGVVLGPERAVAWRVLSAEYFGLAQRRARVFVVASARVGFDPAAVLFEFDGVRRDSAPSREQGQSPAGSPALGVATAGGCRGIGTDVGLTPSWWDGTQISQTLDAVLHKGQTMPEKNRFPAVLQPLSVALRGREGGGTAELGDEISGALRASGGGGDKPHVLSFTCKDYGADLTQDMTPTMRAMGGVQANGGGQLAVCVTGDIAHTLRAEGFDASEDGTARGTPIVVHGTQDPCVSGMAFALGRNNGGENAVYFPDMAVRRIMPVEAERLQGFPDNHTLVPVGRRMAADGPRYKQIGNSWAVPVVRWIGQRIAAHIAEKPAIDHRAHAIRWLLIP